MFDSTHYVPILKWKRAEQRALEVLKNKDKDHITPLIELVMPTVPRYKDKEGKVRRTPEEIFLKMVSTFREVRIQKIPEEILKYWGHRPIFIDFSLLHAPQDTTRLKVESLKKIVTTGVELDLDLIPVINLSDDKEIKETACLLSKKHNKGICLRIVSSDLADIENLNKKIGSFLLTFDLSEESINLLVDIKEKGDQYLQYMNLSQKIKNLTNWKNFIFASGAFPEDLSECKFDEENLIPRTDWKSWKKHVASKELQRKPTFADYTIRYPIYNESLQYYHPTASIKYTHDNNWLVMKGKKQEFKLYLANAKLLAGSPYFYGEKFSDGDKTIAEKAKHFEQYTKNPKIKGTGSTETWLRAGINHHLTLVAYQIANLS